MKKKLTIEILIEEAREFSKKESLFLNRDLYGVTDGKAVGTYIEHKFHEILISKYSYEFGSSAKGIDFPDPSINTDLKVTSITQPQSSCPFKDASQKIYGLGYHLLVFVYDKLDDPHAKTTTLNFRSCTFVDKERTADFQTTRAILQMVENNANTDDIEAYLRDRNLPVDDVAMNKLAVEILSHPPKQGYLTISNALQWRLQYQRIVKLTEAIEGIVQIVSI